MPIGLLVPAFLVGALALGVPLLLHLRRRDRRRPVPFPSLMFLTALPTPSDRRRRLTDWPLLLLRAAIIAALVLAFARPFLRSGEVVGTGGEGLTVLLLDRSASMAAEGSIERWRTAADSVIAALPPGRRGAVIAFDTEADILAGPTADPALLRAAVATAPPPGGGTRLGPAFRAAAGLLAGERVPGAVVLVSDMQRSALSNSGSSALPRGVVVEQVAVTPVRRDNSAVVAVEVEPVGTRDGRRGVVVARIVRHGGVDSVSRHVVLQLDGRDRGQRTVTLPPEGMVTVAFDTVDFARAAVRVDVALDGDVLPSDDHYRAVLPAEQRSRVLLVVPRDVRADEFRYVEQALAIGSDPGFEVVRTSAADPAAMAASQVVILLDVPLPDRDDVAQWLSQGGGLMVVAGDRLARRGALPATLALRGRGTRQRVDGAGVGGVLVTHPALSGLADVGSAALTGVRVRRYAAVEPADQATVLARYDDGTPALLAAAVGQGRALLSTIPLGSNAGDFPLQVDYLPFLRGAVGWLAGVDRTRLAWTAGEPWPVPADLSVVTLREPGGNVLRPAAGSRQVVLRQSGFHEVFSRAQTASVPLVVAVNAPASEADLTPLASGDLLLGVTDAVQPEAAMAPADLAVAREERQSPWRWLLLAVLGLVVVETAVASIGWRGIAAGDASPRSSGGSP